MSFFDWITHRTGSVTFQYQVHITEKAVERANAELMDASTHPATTQVTHGDVYARNNLVRPTMEQVAEAAKTVMLERAR